jgi:hypothetical protein
MSPTSAIGLVAALGALGGVVKCAIAGEFNQPHGDTAGKVWRPGWLGHVLIGMTAAVVIWGVYGPIASLEVGSAEPVKITFSQLLSSILVGISGSTILTLLSQREAEKHTRDTLTKITEELTRAKRGKK